MNQKDWQRAYNDTPEDFHLRLIGTLDVLEERKMKKGFKFSTVLIAAVIIAILASGAYAASKLGIFHMLAPIVPLEGAEEMVVTGLGYTENELVSVTVEEAVFDGQMVLVQFRLRPKNIEQYVLFAAFMQDAPEDVYIAENEQVSDDEWEFRVVGRRDGKQIINYSMDATTIDGSCTMTGADVEEREDGSLVYWMEGEVDKTIDKDELDLEIKPFFSLNGEQILIDPLTIRIPKAGEMRHAQLIPVGAPLEHFEIVSAGIDFTSVAGTLTVAYLYEKVPEDKMGVNVYIFDSDGNEVNTGNGSGYEVDGIKYLQREIQSFSTLPEKLWVEAKVIGQNVALGRIECEVIEVPEPVVIMPDLGGFSF